MKKRKLIFASLIYPGKDFQTDGLLLAESVRAFAGSLSQATIWYLFPETGEPFTASFKDRLQALGVTLIPIQVDPTILNFPLACDPVAAAYAELLASDQADLLAWLGANTVVLQEPLDFLLPESINLGVRPVHHTLIGSRFDRPPDQFWEWIYKVCEVPANHIFPMTTHVDATVIRPYINAGALIARPELGLFAAWCEKFLALYQAVFLQEIYELDWRYKVFIHQAVLTGMVLAALPPEKIRTLPDTYNYPLHLFGEDISGRRPPRLEELVTFRHEGFYKNVDWQQQIPAGDRLKRWLAGRLPEKD